MSETSPPQMDAAIRLLDRQILDPDGRMVGKVDDVELRIEPDGRYVVAALLIGPGALGPRLDGAFGNLVTAVWQRLAHKDRTEPGRIDIRDVAEIGSSVRLSVRRATVDVDGFERWVRDKVIAPLPGSGHDPEDTP